jgi:hypothetical protein
MLQRQLSHLNGRKLDHRHAGNSSKLVFLFIAGVAYHALSCMDFVKCSTASSMSTAVLSGIFKSIVLSSICRNKFQFVFLFVKDGCLVFFNG